MIISKKKKIKKDKFKNKKFKNFYRYYFFTTIILFIICVSSFFNSDMWNYYKVKLHPRLEAYGILNYTKLPEVLYLKLKGHFINNNKIVLDIDFKEILKIESERNQVIKETSRNEFSPVNNYTFQFNYYKATLLVDGKKVPIKIRLKGDRDIHWKEQIKSSYRIKLKGDERFNGLKEFSIQKPRVRNYVYEWIYHQLNSIQNNSIDLKYEFFDLYINGENYGLYVLEETFSEILIERNKKRNGPIFAVKEEYQASKFINEKFQVYKKSFWLNEKNIEITNIAHTKLKELFSNKRTVNETFDVKNLAWYMATSELLHTYHGLYLKSPKYYYNPLKGLFEIIPFDGHWWNPILSSASENERYKLLGENDIILNKTINLDKIIAKEDSLNAVDFGEFLSRKLHEEEKFAKEYYLSLVKISKKIFLDNFFDIRKKDIEHINAQIYADYFWNDFLNFYGPGIYYFNKKTIYKKADYIRKRLQTDPLKISAKLNANILEVENRNLINPYLKINKIYCGKNEISLQKPLIVKNFKKRILQENLKALNCSKINVYDEFNGKNFIIEFDHLKIVKKTERNKLKFLDYFKVEEKKLLLVKNSVDINENIYIPDGYTVKILPGQKIFLKNNAFIYSLSNFIIGENDNNKKVSISGNKDNYGGGIFINSKVASEIFNTEFNYLSGVIDSPNQNSFLNEFLIYGSLNLFNGSVDIQNVNFKNIKSEDALNLINIKFKVKNVSFYNIKSDAIDADFSNGSISNSRFDNVGNDGIDFSGSNSTVVNCDLRNIGDKGISIGEASNIKINNIRIVNSFIGFAIKDNSTVKITNSSLKNGAYGLVTYQKKKEYENKNKIFLENIETINFDYDFIANRESIIKNKTDLEIINYKNKKILEIVNERT